MTEIVGTHPYYGTIAVNDGIAFCLTPCCQATAKGLEDGVGCRACYRIIPPQYGMAWKADSPEFTEIIMKEMT